MKGIKTTGLVLFLIALSVFTAVLFLGKFQLSETTFSQFIENKGIKSEVFIQDINKDVVGKEYNSQFELSADIITYLEFANNIHKENQEWDKVIWDKPHNLSYELIKPSGTGLVAENKGLFWWLTFGLGIFGALLFIIPNFKLLGPEGIKNNGIYQNAATNRGWIGMVAFVYLVGFYVLLYFKADYVINWTYILDPVSTALSGNLASQWFLYGFLYCTVMTVMAVRMYIKYRHNKYQIVRTTSVLFFQIGFAFLIPEIMVRFNQPYYDFKNAFPLDYDFFFDWNLNSLIASGNIGIFILVWGITLTLVVVPIMVYFFGKRWYCSWVCGCGGLAETLGDPYRQLSSKKW